MATIQTWFDQDIFEPVHVRYLDGNVFSADNAGNIVGFRMFEHGEPATLTGSVSASIIRSDGVTVSQPGTLNNNSVYVFLPQAAYVVPGVISVVVKLTSGSTITTMGALVANVYQSTTDTVVDPGTIIPSVETLIAEIEAAIASIPADYSSLWAAVASPFSTSKTYKFGDVCVYDGNLYRCVVETHSGTWNADNFRGTTLGDEINSTNEAAASDNVPLTWTDGKYINDSGGLTTNANYSYTNYILIPPNATALIRAYFAASARIAVYDSAKTKTDVYSNETAYTKCDVVLTPSKNTRYVRLSSYLNYKSGAFAKVLVLPQNIVASMGERVEATNKYLTDCDSAEQNSIYTITTTIDNLPDGQAGTLVTLNGAFNNGVNGSIQLFLTRYNDLYSRIHWGSSGGVWTAWQRIAIDSHLVKEIGERQATGGTVITDCDNADSNRIYTIVNAVDNCPAGRVGTLFTFNGDSSFTAGQAQIFVSSYGEVYTRMRWGSSGGSWSDWQQSVIGTPGCYFSGVGLFERIGVIGDSFASGTIYTPGVTEDRTYYPLSWGQIMARDAGAVCENYSRGGYNTYDFVQPGHSYYNTRGLGKVLTDISGGNACGLYLLCMGINDSNNTKTYGDKTGGLDYLGSSADIKSDPAQNGNSFWGNYGRIISAIQTASPASRIVLCTFKRNPTTATAEGYEPYRTAITEIAAYFNLPCIKLDDDSFFNSSFYMSQMVGSHPTGPQYVGYAKGMERLISRAMVDYYDYFKEYIGLE